MSRTNQRGASAPKGFEAKVRAYLDARAALDAIAPFDDEGGDRACDLMRETQRDLIQTPAVTLEHIAAKVDALYQRTPEWRGDSLSDEETRRAIAAIASPRPTDDDDLAQCLLAIYLDLQAMIGGA